MGCCEELKRAKRRLEMIERELKTREKQIQDVRDCLERQIEYRHDGDLHDTLFYMRGIMPPRDEANLLLIQEASRYIGVQESGGENKGTEVELFQKAVDGKAQGEPWCASFVMYCLGRTEEFTGLHSDIYRSEHCLTVWNQTPREMRLQNPQPGCIVIWRYGDTTSGHMGMVRQILDDDRMITIEGNTSPSAEVDREGDGVFEKVRYIHPKGRMQIVGYLLPF